MYWTSSIFAYLFCELHNLVLFRPMPHANKMIGFEIRNIDSGKTKIVRQQG